MIRFKVVGDDAVATAFVRAAVKTPAEARQACMEAAHEIEQAWESGAPVLSGYTASDPVNVVTIRDGAGTVGAEVANLNFVAYFLQHGTSKMDPQYDFIAEGDAAAEGLPDRLAEIAADL